MKKKVLIGLAIAIAIFLALLTQVGFYTVQPLGGLPSGVTLLVWRYPGDPTFESPDALCLRTTGSITLLCRGVALAMAPTPRILLRLPYIELAYNLSTIWAAKDEPPTSTPISPSPSTCHTKTFTGSGDHVLALPYSFAGCVKARMAHRGERNFIVYALDGSYTQVELLANEIGPYDGVVRWDTRTAALEIKADGSWSITIE